ncbi:MAG: hypothetical protein WHX60_01670 [Armatimonadota bacterium]
MSHASAYGFDLSPLIGFFRRHNRSSRFRTAFVMIPAKDTH